uniref:Uncharacterized protein n=1 Tax=Monopterus albus TaxID=43700 RepID=A0A3Q3Q1W7_MONAL
FETEEEARAMAKFYNSNVTASVCGRPVRVNHSLTYPTIQVSITAASCGSSRVVYIGQIPSSKYADDTILKLAEPFGNIKKYFLNRIKRECFIEMEKAEDAEKMAEEYKVNPPNRAKREISSTPTKSSKHPEEPPAKKSREDMSLEEKSEEEKLEEKREEEEEMQSSDVRMEAKQEEETSAESISDQNQNVNICVKYVSSACLVSAGVEHVKMGYYCRVCFLFYSNEDTAKKTHCSSQMHYDKLQVKKRRHEVSL